jgi:hypothetical protein
MRSPLSHHLEEQKRSNIIPKIGDLVSVLLNHSDQNFGFITDIRPLDGPTGYPYIIYIYDYDEEYPYKESEFQVFS